jgi:tripartite-type tricarboxylate transporter receptor subunit TctC
MRDKPPFVGTFAGPTRHQPARELSCLVKTLNAIGRFRARALISVTASAIALVAALTVMISPAQSQQFPTRQIEDSPWGAAGGDTDLVNRLLAKAMEKELGTSIVVVNRTGNGVAMNHVWSLPHDGYSWIGSSEGMQIAASMGFHSTTTKDWRWYMAAGGMAALAVRADSPFKTVDDLIAAAKADPGKVNVSHCQFGCVFHLKWVALAEAAKVKFNYVPYPGSAPAIVALLAGDSQAVITSMSEQAEYVKSGRVRTLGMVEMKPLEFEGKGTFPAIGEEYPDIQKLPAQQWLGFGVPADTPKAVTDRLDAAFVKALQDEALKKFARDRNIFFFGAYGDEAQKILLKVESGMSWKMYELGIAKISPEKFGIPKP